MLQHSNKFSTNIMYEWNIFHLKRCKIFIILKFVVSYIAEDPVYDTLKISGKWDGQKCPIWPRQMVSKASRGILDVFTPICCFPINTLEGAQAATAYKGVKTGSGM